MEEKITVLKVEYEGFPIHGVAENLDSLNRILEEFLGGWDGWDADRAGDEIKITVKSMSKEDFAKLPDFEL